MPICVQTPTMARRCTPMNIYWKKSVKNFILLPLPLRQLLQADMKRSGSTAIASNFESTQKMKEEQKAAFKRDRFVKYKELSASYVFYAIQRIDLLIISISGAGIYIIFETLRFFKENELVIDLYWLKMGGGLFASAIIVNFASQWTGFAANKNEENWAELKIEETMDQEVDKCKMCRVDKNVSTYNTLTTILNITSTVLMIAGVILLIWFNFTRL